MRLRAQSYLLRPLSRVRRGAALMIVMVVVAVATVLGFAMVSASSLQAQATSNLKYVSTAEYLADSGAQLALYYLQYPTASPVAIPDGYYPGQTGVTFGNAVAGSADITVSYDSASDRYTVTSVGKATTPSGTINKTVTASVAVIRQFRQTCAVMSTSNIRLPSLCTVLNGLQTNAQLNAYLGSAVTGTARYRSITGTGTVQDKQPLSASETVTVPTLATIKDYTGTYTYQGQTYTAQKLTSTTLSFQTLPTPADAVTNPAGIYWSDQNVNLNGGVTINGTLVITNGKLTVNNPLSILSYNSITPKSGFPAVVSQSDIDIRGLLSSTTFNGLVWTGGGLKTGILTSSLSINGAFLSVGGAPIDTNYKGSLTISFDADKCSVPDFSTTNTVIVGVRVVSWNVS